MEKFLIRNAIKCLECGEVLESVHVHDYKECSCPNQTMVDGGLEYVRFGGVDMNKLETQCVYSNDDISLIREHLMRGTYGINGDEPYSQVALKTIDDSLLEAMIKYEEELRPSNRYLPLYRKEQEFRKVKK